MKKKILVYRWGAVNEPLFCEALGKLGYDRADFCMEMKHYHADAEFAQAFIRALHTEHADAVFSYDYFPLISMICEMNRIPYISWIYDCPQYTLLSRTLTNDCNVIFCFDKVYTERLQVWGAKRCIHYPLAGDLEWLERAQNGTGLTESRETQDKKKSCDISFVGNLYNGEKNRFRQIQLSSYTAGVAEGMMQAQLCVYGTNFMAQALPDDVVKEIVQKCGLTLGTEYRSDDRQMAADVLSMEVSARERELVLGSLGEKFSLHLYTASDLPPGLLQKKVQVSGYADYEKEVPLIFYNSKINLNITSKTIETGIPQRVFDILSCGGFCITNYQTEIAECFEDGKELVMYTDMADLLKKAEYYLSHEEERKQIAQNGRRKVERAYSLPEKVRGMLEAAKC